MFSLDTRIPVGMAFSDSSTIVLNTRSNVGLNSCNDTEGFVLDIRDPSLASPLKMHGRITDAGGVGLANATVAILRGGMVMAQTTTDAQGYYQLPQQTIVACVLKVTVPGYATAARALTLSAATALENFQLATLPPAPTVQQVSRAAPFTVAPVGALGETLEIFNGSVFEQITPDNAPSPNRMTIVMTHGWNSDPTVWAQSMASNMIAQGVSANILAYDWQYVAYSPGLPASEAYTPAEGVFLGQSLQAELGANYSQPIHFIGHSLGTIVNAVAANYLHGEQTAHQEVSPTPWPAIPIHVTLLDEAEELSSLVEFTGYEGWFDGLTVILKKAGLPLASPPSGVSLLWKPTIPIHAAWVDNYISKFGFYHSEAVNVRLDKANLISELNPISEAVDRHAYSYKWYGMTVTNPAECILGFQRSYEARLANLSGFDFPPSTSEFPAGILYVQPLVALDALALTPQAQGTVVVGSQASSILLGAAGAVQAKGNVSAATMDSAQGDALWMENGFNFITGIANQDGQGIMNLSQAPIMRLQLRTIAPANQQVQQNAASMLQDQAENVLTANDASSPADSSAMAWIPIFIPSNTVVMAFDFSSSGNPVDDVLMCGIGTNNLFSLAAKFIPTNTVSSSSLLDVSAWAGATNELFFGLVGGTSTNATLQIDNIRFYSFQPPVALFTASPTNDPAALSAIFTDSSSGTITNWFWDFGDGASTNLVATSVSHTYASPGTNVVRLIVSGPTGSGTNTQIVVTSLQSMVNVVANPTNGGSVFGAGAFEVGTSALLLAVPSNGWLFVRWNDGATNNSYTIIVPASDITYTANFSKIDNVGDGIPDWWRARYFGGDGSATSALSCATSDPDGDGLNNLQEYLAGTDPTNGASALALTGIAIVSNDVLVTWVGGTNAWQQLQCTSALTDSNAWLAIFTNAPPTPITNTYLHPGAGSASNLFYRVKAWR